MKKVIAVVVAILMLMVLVAVILTESDEEELCEDESGGSASGSSLPSVDGFAFPEENALDHITSGFGQRWGSMHQGVDIAQGAGTPIYAFADGVVADSGPASGFGNWIVIDHSIAGKQYSTVYGHIFDKDLLVSKGDTVKAGQHIANEGYNGSVSPPGPGGSHLHFEIWENTRLGGGFAIDPEPWLRRIGDSPVQAENNSTGSSSEASTSSTAGSSGELPPTDKLASEANMQKDAIRVARAVAQRFPQIQEIGGWRTNGGKAGDHPEGRAVDFMIPNNASEEGIALGDEVLAYVLGNADDLNVQYAIWRQTYYTPDGYSEFMKDRYSYTENHYDHVHVTVHGAGFPSVNETYAAAPEGGGSIPGINTGECVSHDGVDESLNAAMVPEEFRKWVVLSARQCAILTPALQAALLQQESGFNVNAVSPAGATGPAQFMPATWASAGAEVDDKGKVIGPPGSGDIRSPRDATMASGRFLCQLAEQNAQWKAEGKISGDDIELMLAAYNAGGGNVLSAGGVPQFAETQNYVKKIPELAQQFAATMDEESRED